MSIATNILEKQPSETKQLMMDFSGSMETGETITSITARTATPTGTASDIVLDAADVISSQKAGLLISGGEDNKTYKIRYIILTSNSQVLEFEGYLKIKEL